MFLLCVHLEVFMNLGSFFCTIFPKQLFPKHYAHLALSYFLRSVYDTPLRGQKNFVLLFSEEKEGWHCTVSNAYLPGGLNDSLCIQVEIFMRLAWRKVHGASFFFIRACFLVFLLVRHQVQ